MKRSLMMRCSILLVLILIAYPVSAQIVWEKYSGNPVMTVDSAGSWDESNIGGPCVLNIGSTYEMWYTGNGESNRNQIGHATSPDGLIWAKDSSNPVLQQGGTGAWDEKAVASPSVLFDGTSYKMWYNGTASNGIPYIGYASSADGVIWTKHAGNPVMEVLTQSWESYYYFGNPEVLFDGTTYKMWYHSGRGSESISIGYATSVDGINWTKYANNPVLQKGGSGDWDVFGVFYPDVIFANNLYHMWFSGTENLSATFKKGYATSVDGINWTKYENNPVLSPGPETYDQDNLWGATTIYEEGVLKMWYVGKLSGSASTINYATSTHTDVAGGPVYGTWTLANSPYYIQGEITVPNDSTLTIEPGVQVEFQGHYKLNVQGRLIASGTETESIIFTVSDTSGFSNNASSEGVWGGIRFDATPVTNDSSLLKYCVIEYAKTFAIGPYTFDGPHGGGIFIKNYSKVRVEKCLMNRYQTLR